jgi:hypothetical protein
MRAMWVNMAAVSLAAVTNLALAEDGCSGFQWNVSRERALFATQAEALSPGSEPSSAPIMRIDHLYRWTLAPQDKVTFAVPPGKKMLVDGAHAGLARFRVDAPGLYRISLDQPFWIDIVADGKIIQSKDFQGMPGCQAPHKVVQYELPAAKDLLIQLSGATNPDVRVTVTRTPRG